MGNLPSIAYREPGRPGWSVYDGTHGTEDRTVRVLTRRQVRLLVAAQAERRHSPPWVSAWGRVYPTREGGVP